MIKKEDGAYTVQSAVTFDSAHTDNGDVVGKTFEFKTLNLNKTFELPNQAWTNKFPINLMAQISSS